MVKFLSVTLSSRSTPHYAAILVAAVVLCHPLLLWGVPPGDAATLHVMYQSHFSEQFWYGDYYPRWLANANKGLGSPVFFLQYPLPYFVTALLRPFIWFPVDTRREAHELGFFFFLVITAAGFAGRMWFRKHSGDWASTIAAIVYMSLPYVLSEGVYARAALGEVCCFVWMPLALAICVSTRRGFTAVSLLATALACLILSNAIIAVLFVPVLIFYVLGRDLLTVRAAIRRVALLFSSLVLGIGMSAIYLFPVIVFRPLFDWSQMPANLPGYELGRYFLYLTTDSIAADSKAPLAIAGHDVIIGVVLCGTIGFMLAVLAYAWYATLTRAERIWIYVLLGLALLSTVPNLGPTVVRASGLALSEINSTDKFTERALLVTFSTLGLGLLAYCTVADAGARRDRVLLAIASGAFAFMLPWSAPIWKALPVLSSIQYPIRLGSVLSVAVVGLVARAIDQSAGRANDVNGRRSLLVLIAALAWVIGGGLLTWRVDWSVRLALGLSENGRADAEARTRVDHARAVDIPYRTYVAPRSVEAFAQRLGTTPRDGNVNVTATGVESPVAECVNGGVVVDLRRLVPRELIGVVDCPGDGRVRVNQVYWPLWKLVGSDDYNGYGVITSSAEGLLEFALPPGRHELHLVLERASSEYWGAIVTVVSVLGVILGCGVEWFVRWRNQ